MNLIPSRSPATGYLLATISAFGVGVSTVLGKWNLQEVEPLTMNCLIFSVAAVGMTVGWLPFREKETSLKVTNRGWMWLIALAIVQCSAVWFYWLGVQIMDPSLAAFLNRSRVVIALLLGIFILKERLNRWEVIGTVVAMVGIVVMRATLRLEYTPGFAFVLMGAVLFGVTELLSKIVVRHIRTSVLAYYRNLIMMVLYWLAFAVVGGSFDGVMVVWPGIVALGLLGPIVNRLFYFSALERLEMVKVSVIGQIQPVFVIVLSVTFLDMLPSLREMIGGIFLVIGAIILVAFRRRMRQSFSA
ncbi:EamA family transporter [candidate division GN15 bacterium]|nr:EamA family transporter [candidate division GN15 bacterium]